MSEIRQIPDEFNSVNPEDYLIVQRGNSPYETGKIKAENLNIGDSGGNHDTVLTSIRPFDYVLVEEALSPWRKGKVELQNLGISDGASNIVNTYIDNVPPDPNINTLNIGDKWIQYDGDIVINEWHYSRVNGEYRWVGSLFNTTIATNILNDSVIIPADYDLYIDSFTSYLRFNSINPTRPDYYFLLALYYGAYGFSSPYGGRIAENRFDTPVSGSKYTGQVPVREIVSSKFNDNFPASETSAHLMVANISSGTGSSSFSSINTITTALVFKE